MRRAPRIRRDREPTIALINVVFLMLIFFLIAGTLAPALDDRLTLVRASDLAEAPPPDGLLILADGTLLGVSGSTTTEAVGAAGGKVRVVPDRDLPAADLVRIGRELRAAGAESVVIVAERGLQ